MLHVFKKCKDYFLTLKCSSSFAYQFNALSRYTLKKVAVKCNSN